MVEGVAIMIITIHFKDGSIERFEAESYKDTPGWIRFVTGGRYCRQDKMYPADTIRKVEKS